MAIDKTVHSEDLEPVKSWSVRILFYLGESFMGGAMVSLGVLFVYSQPLPSLDRELILFVFIVVLLLGSRLIWLYVVPRSEYSREYQRWAMSRRWRLSLIGVGLVASLLSGITIAVFDPEWFRSNVELLVVGPFLFGGICFELAHWLLRTDYTDS